MEEHYIVKRVSVPVNLEELMNGLTKEILKNQPKDVILFASEYFTKLLKLRDEGYTGFARTRTKSSAIKLTPRKEKQIAKTVTKPAEKLTIDTRMKPFSRQVSLHVTNVDLVSKIIDHHGIVDNYIKRKRETENKEKVVSDKGKQNNSLSDNENIQGVKKHMSTKQKPTNKTKTIVKRNISKSERADSLSKQESEVHHGASNKFVPKNVSIEEEGKFTKGGLLAVVAPKPRKKTNISAEDVSISIPVPLVPEKKKNVDEKSQEGDVKENEKEENKKEEKEKEEKEDKEKEENEKGEKEEKEKEKEKEEKEKKEKEEKEKYKDDESKTDPKNIDNSKKQTDFLDNVIQLNEQNSEPHITEASEVLDKTVNIQTHATKNNEERKPELEAKDQKTKLTENQKDAKDSHSIETETTKEKEEKTRKTEEKNASLIKVEKVVKVDGYKDDKVDLGKNEEVEKLQETHTKPKQLEEKSEKEKIKEEEPAGDHENAHKMHTQENEKIKSEAVEIKNLQEINVESAEMSLSDKSQKSESDDHTENSKNDYKSEAGDVKKAVSEEFDKEKIKSVEVEASNQTLEIKHSGLKTYEHKENVEETEKGKTLHEKDEKSKDVPKNGHEKEDEQKLKNGNLKKEIQDNENNKTELENEVIKIEHKKDEDEKLKDNDFNKDEQNNAESKVDHKKGEDVKSKGDDLKKDTQDKVNIEIEDKKEYNQDNEKAEAENKKGKDEKLKDDGLKKYNRANEKVDTEHKKGGDQKLEDGSLQKGIQNNVNAVTENAKDEDEKLKDDVLKKDNQDNKKIETKFENDQHRKLQNSDLKRDALDNIMVAADHEKDDHKKLMDDNLKKTTEDNVIIESEHKKDEDEKLKDNVLKKDDQDNEKIKIENKKDDNLKEDTQNIIESKIENTKDVKEKLKDEDLKEVTHDDTIKIETDHKKGEDEKLKKGIIRKDALDNMKIGTEHIKGEDEKVRDDIKESTQANVIIETEHKGDDNQKLKDDDNFKEDTQDNVNSKIEKDNKLKDNELKKDIPYDEKIETKHKNNSDEKLKEEDDKKDIQDNFKIETEHIKTEEEKFKDDDFKEGTHDKVKIEVEQKIDEDEKLKDDDNKKHTQDNMKIEVEHIKGEDENLKDDYLKKDTQDTLKLETEHKKDKDEKLKGDDIKKLIPDNVKVENEYIKGVVEKLKDDDLKKTIQDTIKVETKNKKDKVEKLKGDDNGKEAQDKMKIETEHITDKEEKLKDDDLNKDIKHNEKIKTDQKKHDDDGNEKDIPNELNKTEHGKDVVGEEKETKNIYLIKPLGLSLENKDEIGKDDLHDQQIKQGDKFGKLQEHEATNVLVNKANSQETEKNQTDIEKQIIKGTEIDLKAASSLFLKMGFRTEGKEEARASQESEIVIKGNETDTNGSKGVKIINESIDVKDIKTVTTATNPDLNKHDGVLIQKGNKIEEENKVEEHFTQIQEQPAIKTKIGHIQTLPMELKQTEEIANKQVVSEESHYLDKSSSNETSIEVTKNQKQHGRDKEEGSVDRSTKIEVKEIEKMDFHKQDDNKNNEGKLQSDEQLQETAPTKNDTKNIAFVKDGSEPGKYNEEQNKPIDENQLAMDNITENAKENAEQTPEIKGDDIIISENKVDVAEAEKGVTKAQETNKQLQSDKDQQKSAHSDDEVTDKVATELQSNDTELKKIIKNEKVQSTHESTEALTEKEILPDISDKPESEQNINLQKIDEEIIKSEKNETKKSEEISKTNGREDQRESERESNVGNFLDPSISNQTAEPVQIESDSKQLVRMKTVEEIPCEKVIVAPLIDHGSEGHQQIQTQHFINERISQTDVETALKEKEKQLEISTSGVEITPKDEKIMEEDKKSQLSIAEGREEINGNKQTFMVSELHSSGDASNISSKNRTVHNIVPTRPAASDIAGNLIPNENKRSSGIDKHDDITENNQLQTSDSNLTCLNSNSESDIAQEHLDTMKNILLEINLEEDKNSDQINNEEEPSISEEEIKGMTDTFLRCEQGFTDKKHTNENSISETDDLKKVTHAGEETKDATDNTFVENKIEEVCTKSDEAQVSSSKEGRNYEDSGKEASKVENDEIKKDLIVSDIKAAQDTKDADLTNQNDNKKDENVTVITKVPEILKQEAELKEDVTEDEIQKESVTKREVAGLENIGDAKDDFKDHSGEITKKVDKENEVGRVREKQELTPERTTRTLRKDEEFKTELLTQNLLDISDEKTEKKEKRITENNDVSNFGAAVPIPIPKLANTDLNLKLGDKIDDEKLQNEKIMSTESQKHEQNEEQTKSNILEEQNTTDTEKNKELQGTIELMKHDGKDNDQMNISVKLVQGENDTILPEATDKLVKLKNSEKIMSDENIKIEKMDSKGVGQLAEGTIAAEEKLKQLKDISNDNQEVAHATKSDFKITEHEAEEVLKSVKEDVDAVKKTDENDDDGTGKKREAIKEGVSTKELHPDVAKINLNPEHDKEESLLADISNPTISKDDKDKKVENNGSISSMDNIQSVAEKMASAVELSKELLKKLELSETGETIKEDTSKYVKVNPAAHKDDSKLEIAENSKQTKEQEHKEIETPDISKPETKLTINLSDSKRESSSDLSESIKVKDDEANKKKDIKQIQDIPINKKDKGAKRETDKNNKETEEENKSLIIKPVEIKNKLNKTRSVSITRENKKKDQDPRTPRTPRNVDKKPVTKSFSTSHINIKEKNDFKTDRKYVSKSSSVVSKDKEGDTESSKQVSDKSRGNFRKRSLDFSTKKPAPKVEDKVDTNKPKKEGNIFSDEIVKKTISLPESSKSILLTDRGYTIPDDYVKDVLLTNGHDKATQEEEGKIKQENKEKTNSSSKIDEIDWKDFMEKERQFWMTIGDGKLELNLTQNNKLHEDEKKKNIESPHEAVTSSDQSTSDQVSSELLSSQTNFEQIYQGKDNENGIKHSRGVVMTDGDGSSRLSSASSNDGSNNISIHTEQLNATSFPLSMPINQDAAGVEGVTSETVGSSALRTTPTAVGDVVVVGTGVVGSTQTQTEKGRARGSATASSTVAQHEMDANHKTRRNNSSLAHQENKNMEEVAATKIQASFRGYQVRKQLKTKNGGTEAISQGRVGRRKNSGKLRSSDVSAVSKNASQKKNTDIEERSATKIQAGVRGFLVRRRFKKEKPNTTPGSS